MIVVETPQIAINRPKTVCVQSSIQAASDGQQRRSLSRGGVSGYSSLFSFLFPQCVSLRVPAVAHG
jgi:hypothetical protein